MLIRNPKEFERVAQEWAVKYAGAPKRERGEGSGGSGTQTKKQQERRSKADEEAERVAKYVSSTLDLQAYATSMKEHRQLTSQQIPRLQPIHDR